MSPSTLRPALVLGLLSCVGPFAIDMYLPALPAIATDLQASVASVQWTLTAFFIGFGVSQLVWGPWSDQAGRRLPLLVGLFIFTLATIGCAFAPDIGTLAALRFVEGVGAAVVMVVPRAIIRDMHTGTEATRLMALVMLVISVSPMLAPLAGSGVIAVADWRGVFWVLVAAAILSAVLTVLLLPETLPREERVPVDTRSLLSGARTLLADTHFMRLTFIGAFGFASFFVFIASASFVYTTSFGLSPTGFSLAFAANAIGFFAASQAAAPAGERFGATRVVVLATAGFCLFSLVFLSLAIAGLATLPVTIGCLFLANACLGLVIPTTMVMALDPHGEIAGLASSLGGTLQMLTGGAVGIAAGPFFDGTVLPTAAAIAACGVAALGLAVARPLDVAASAAS